MCGIAGFFHPSHIPSDPGVLRAMAGSIAHRGPDHEGLYQDGCPFDCGLCSAHAQRTCTALVEVTERCNLCCPVCFADSGGNTPDPDLETLRRMFSRIMDRTGGCNLQLSGGEPTVREDLLDIVRAAGKAGFSFVQLNSNGLALAREPELAHLLKDAGLSSVFLQFDGVTDAVFRRLRGRDLLEVKCRAVENLAAAGLGVVLVLIIGHGMNLEERRAHV